MSSVTMLKQLIVTQVSIRGSVDAFLTRKEEQRVRDGAGLMALSHA